MKILIYSAKDFEIPFLEHANNDIHAIKYIPERLTSKTAMLALGFDVISIFSADDASSVVLEKLKDFGVEYITLRSAGYDNINLAKAAALGLRVANVPEYSPYAIAEHAVALLLALNRKLILSDQQVTVHNFSLSNLIGFDLKNKTVGIVGFGRIGKVIGKIMYGFGCEILANDVSFDPDFARKYTVQYAEKKELCNRSDVIILSTPLTSQTHHMVDASLISQMKKEVLLINIARGAVVDTKELLKALEENEIGGYGTDVYEYEHGIFFYDHSNTKLEDDLLQQLINSPKVLVTPHQAFATKEALTDIAKTTFASINCWERNESSKNELMLQLSN